MENSICRPSAQQEQTATGAQGAPLAEDPLAKVTGLVDALAAGAEHDERSLAAIDGDNQLPLVRLGIAASLFSALRSAHPHTADHSLRVALGCSAWCEAEELDEQQRDWIEVAALMHDIGKLAVPDDVLLKPGPLSTAEWTIMQRHRRMSVDILRASCRRPEILEIIAQSGSWYDGSSPGSDGAGQSIPLGARMLSIVDAFDAMVSEQFYRPAMPREAAFNELHRAAGTQFDPTLVGRFCELHECDELKLRQRVSDRWIHTLSPTRVDAPWQLNLQRRTQLSSVSDFLFQHRLLDHMRDAVVFVDTGLRIVYWNQGAERLTGVSTMGAQLNRWSPRVLEMCDDESGPFDEDSCPVIQAIRTGSQTLRRISIRGRSGRKIAVEAHIAPVIDADGSTQGATLLLHDVSPEISLESRCQSLQVLATRDPMTQVANRAEFDRVLELFVVVHLEQQRPCSLVICDIDHFKNVNDTHGHQAGDDVIKCLANVLKSSCRGGDLVARYGGEEFVLLYIDCDNAAAARRAEDIRKTFGRIRQPMLLGNRVTASFGVTEIQEGDTPEIMLRRADRALLDAKRGGRNAVVQLGAGCSSDECSLQETNTLPDESDDEDTLVERRFVATTPLAVSLEKLRAFIADQDGEAEAISDRHIQVRLKAKRKWFWQRDASRQISLIIDMEFDEVETEIFHGQTEVHQGYSRTVMKIVIRSPQQRGARSTEALERAAQILSSFRKYLMAEEIDDDESFD